MKYLDGQCMLCGREGIARPLEISLPNCRVETIYVCKECKITRLVPVKPAPGTTVANDSKLCYAKIEEYMGKDLYAKGECTTCGYKGMVRPQMLLPPEQHVKTMYLCKECAMRFIPPVNDESVPVQAASVAKGKVEKASVIDGSKPCDTKREINWFVIGCVIYFSIVAICAVLWGLIHLPLFLIFLIVIVFINWLHEEGII